MYEMKPVGFLKGRNGNMRKILFFVYDLSFSGKSVSQGPDY